MIKLFGEFHLNSELLHVLLSCALADACQSHAIDQNIFINFYFCLLSYCCAYLHSNVYLHVQSTYLYLVNSMMKIKMPHAWSSLNFYHSLLAVSHQLLQLVPCFLI